VFDDLHWGEPALFDLIEHIADLSRDAPILIRPRPSGARSQAGLRAARPVR
jgi:hypothetical protein